MLICAPVSSRSGYGDHARDLVRSFLNLDKFDIKIMDVNWGSTPRNALDNELDKNIINCILPEPKMDRQPDVYVDIRIPNEFQTYGKVNIGITAGIETTAVSSKWIEGCNKMDLVIVPSEHSKKGFVDAKYEKIQQLPDGKQQKIGELKLEKPIESLFEGVDEDIYKPIDNVSLDLVDDIKEDFAFLHVGLWGSGGFGEDRKDIAKLVKVFYESFANKKEQPALILKTNGATYSILDREDCLNKINEIKSKFPEDWNLPNVYLLHGSLSVEEMNKLYNHPKVKSFISLTHGEGFGRPMLEASMVGLPVITSGWSGQMDFLSQTDSMLLGGEMVQVPKSQHWKDIIIPESQWFNVNETQTYKAMNHCFQNYDGVKEKALNLMKINRDKFTLNKMTEKLGEIITSTIENVPTQVGINLPKLSESKIKLPKLKKNKSGNGLDSLKKDYKITSRYEELNDKIQNVWGSSDSKAYSKKEKVYNHELFGKSERLKSWDSKTRPRHGFEIIKKLYKDLTKNKQNPIFMELGAELGSSAKEMLEDFKTTNVISVDIWTNEVNHSWPEINDILLDSKYGPFSIYSNVLYDYKDRVIPIKDWTVNGLDTVKSFNVTPDLIYIDASHDYPNVFNDIEKAHNVFPNVTLCGDDFKTKPGVKQSIDEFCQKYNFSVESSENQWIIKKGVKKSKPKINLPKLKKESEVTS